jgi:hypothetical protein
MNEQIKQLAKDAGISFGGHPMNPLNVYPSDLQKFADLIKQAIYDEVKEELTPPELVNIEPDRIDRQYLKGCNGGLTDALYIIKNFGVEEE